MQAVPAVITVPDAGQVIRYTIIPIASIKLEYGTARLCIHI